MFRSNTEVLANTPLWPLLYDSLWQANHQNYLDMIPPEAKEFLTGLTAEDKAVLKEVAKNYASYKNEEEVKKL